MSKTIKEAKLEATESGFNDMPNREIIKNTLEGHELKPVDVTFKDYWQNAEDTVVVAFKAETNAFDAVRAMVALQALGADEIHTLKDDEGRIIIRMWWD